MFVTGIISFLMQQYVRCNIHLTLPEDDADSGAPAICALCINGTLQEVLGDSAVYVWWMLASGLESYY